MVSTGISRFNRDNSTVRVGYQGGVDTINKGEGSSIGQNLRISLSFPLSVKLTETIMSHSGKMVGCSHSVSGVVGSHSTVDMMNKLSVSISLAIKVTVSIETKVVSSSNSVSMVVGSHSTIDMVNKLGISISLTIVQVSITLSSKVLHS